MKRLIPVLLLAVFGLGVLAPQAEAAAARSSHSTLAARHAKVVAKHKKKHKKHHRKRHRKHHRG